LEIGRYELASAELSPCFFSTGVMDACLGNDQQPAIG